MATGEAWLACQSLSRGLVDELMTSNEYLQGKMKDRDVIRVRRRLYKEEKPSVFDFIFTRFDGVLNKFEAALKPRSVFPKVMARL